MLAKQNTHAVPCIPGAIPGGLTRTRFYDGMLLTQADMEREQDFWRMKRKLTNRALGTGVVWGLRLEWDGIKRLFHLGPGYALDCCGNDLVVECPQDVTERALVDKNNPEIKALLSGKTKNALKCPDPQQNDLPRKACVILQYTECAGDPQPVHEDACTSNVTHCEYSSIRESARILLAPPPVEVNPTSIDNFCKRIDALRTACAGEAGCTLFDAADVLANMEFPVVIEYHNLGDGTPASPGSPAVLLRPRVGSDPVEKDETVAPILREDHILINVKPAPGFVLIGGEVANNRGIGIGIDPFGVQLESVGAEILGAAGPAFILSNLQVASLFTNDTSKKADIALAAGIDPADGTGFFNATTHGFENLPVLPSCNDKLSPLLLLNGDPACIGKTLALTVLCGWFKGMLGDEKTEVPSVPNGKHIAAWWVCYIAWKVLFGANLDDAESSSLLSDALQELLEEWCVAFTYPGPYCKDDHHGVYLGCVELSPKGNILCFDAWQHRRHVVTGPLIAHWGSLFGLAPVDVVVGRIAGWICCLRNTSLPVRTGEMAMSMIDGLPLDEYGMALVASEEAALGDYMSDHKLEWDGNVHSMSFADLASRVLEMIVKGGGEERSTLSLSRDVFRIDDSDLYILIPRQRRSFEIGRREGRLEHIVDTHTGPLRPLARSYVSEYAVAIANEVGLSKLAILNDDDVMKTLVHELEKYRILTVADYLKAGPETSARLALESFDEFDHIEDRSMLFAAAEELTLASENLVGSVVDPFLKNEIDTGGGPFLAELLADKGTAKKVGPGIREHLKHNALTNRKLEEIGRKIAERHELTPNRSDE